MGKIEWNKPRDGYTSSKDGRYIIYRSGRRFSVAYVPEASVISDNNDSVSKAKKSSQLFEDKEQKSKD